MPGLRYRKRQGTACPQRTGSGAMDAAPPCRIAAEEPRKARAGVTFHDGADAGFCAGDRSGFATLVQVWRNDGRRFDARRAGKQAWAAATRREASHVANTEERARQPLQPHTRGLIDSPRTVETQAATAPLYKRNAGCSHRCVMATWPPSVQQIRT